jgi:diadenosine tetraphosphate (Ap4A) HIT family hydrolase
VALDRLWAGWRGEYVSGAADPPGEGCVLCRILAGDPEEDEGRGVVWRGERCAVILNAYPYTSGHVMVLPTRHVAELEDLDGEESAALWSGAVAAVAALKAAYSPGGVNLGANLGKAAGAGVPGHLHLHCLPRWDGDTNFMTAVAEARVLPEALPTTWRKVRDAWPDP